MKASMKSYRVRSPLAWAVKLCVACCVVLGVVMIVVLPRVDAQAQYVIAATVAALAIQAIGLMVIVAACLVGPRIARWRARLRHMARESYQSYPPQTAPG